MNEHEEHTGLIFNRKPNEECKVCMIRNRSRLSKKPSRRKKE
jgi:hypothetical protein